MYRLKITFLLIFLSTLNSCSGQEKDTIYLLFKDQESIDCVKPKTNKKADISTIDYQGKMHRLDDKTFFFCQERFIKTSVVKENITLKEFKKINFVDHHYIYNERIEKDMFSKKDTFKNIYIIEVTSSGNYIQHKVYWSNNSD